MIFKRLQISFIFFQQSVKKLQIHTNYPFLLYKLSLIPLISKAINFLMILGPNCKNYNLKNNIFYPLSDTKSRIMGTFSYKAQQHLIFYVQSAVTFSKNSSLFSVKTFGPSKMKMWRQK